MAYNTYSFTDTVLTLNHPSVGQKVFNGAGLGSVSLQYANDVAAHDVAADGTVMISKIVTRNGAMSIAIQQTSDAQEWLKKWTNYLRVAPTSEFAQTTGVLKNVSTGEDFTLNGITPQKMSDVQYQQQGGQITWPLLVAEIINN